jgi:hypothetical protein
MNLTNLACHYKELKMQDVMLDLETLGTRPGCVVLSIGAVAFDHCTNELGPEFYEVIKLSSCLDYGLFADKKSLDWWKDQDHESRQVIDIAAYSTQNLPYVLAQFNIFLLSCDSKNVRLWGNGSDFDNAVLIACYNATGIEPAWKFRNNRCYRTLKNLRPNIKLKRIGTHHHALDDAKTQAIHAMQLLNKIIVPRSED